MPETDEFYAGRSGVLWLDGLDPQPFTILYVKEGSMARFYSRKTVWYDCVEDWLADGYTIEWDK